jgi:uncharacterized protein (TIGR02246 family)
VVLLLVGSSCAGPDPFGRRARSARDEIGAAYKTMEKAFQEGNAELIAANYTEDAEWFAPESPVIKGRAAIGRAWKEAAGSGVAGNRLRIDVAEVDQDGNRANEVGRFTISAPDGGVRTAGTYMAIWARQSDGTWKARREIFNWDIPPRRP